MLKNNLTQSKPIAQVWKLRARTTDVSVYTNQEADEQDLNWHLAMGAEAHTFNPRTLGAETERSHVQAQPGQVKDWRTTSKLKRLGK